MQRLWEVEESIHIKAAADTLYDSVADVRAMGRWSPECRRVWLPRPPVRRGSGFFGFNRKGPWVWFTWCRVVRAERPHAFTFRVSTFGLPVAEWGYRFTPTEDGTRVTEHWTDLRTGRGARLTELLGLVFTGTRPRLRAARNRAGMRTTLHRLKQAAEG
ncbi:SRPBCC family protein [Streptomyces wuyuanensis]|uniref:SRPBCC family protein n=1 Tax=Streptomyces wuyuanensis TaxID=1196353 RepID=UPI003792EE41